jgi:hypothetical protein
MWRTLMRSLDVANGGGLFVLVRVSDHFHVIFFFFCFIF